MASKRAAGTASGSRNRTAAGRGMQRDAARRSGASAGSGSVAGAAGPRPAASAGAAKRPRRSRTRALLWGCLLSWLVLIFVFSSQPYQTQSIQPALERKLDAETVQKWLPPMSFHYNGQLYLSSYNPYDVIEFLFRKAAHLFVYAVLAALAWALARLYRVPPGLSAFIALSLTALIACLDEYNQQFSLSRTPNPEDVLIDWIGGCLGVVLLYLFSTALRRSNRSSRLIS
ncbi:VanZ family protein [Paenibacillus albicereus]|uniref:VanZ family protein n=1 Tax=Paenibacillus albicereus TaxID=2726185 RepID=A0A6H2GUQ5_9BACL|nr:VanZ family protein [Paenibacillus albicereus]QJC51137.1 VanZ family protein [Paenibacillus albicereus]